MIRWSPDSKALWVFSSDSAAAHVDSVDVTSDRRTPLQTIALRDPTGVLSIFSVSLADDPHVYAYNVWPYVSHLFVAEQKR